MAPKRAKLTPEQKEAVLARQRAFVHVKEQYQSLDIVWAKMPSYPWWPAMLFMTWGAVEQTGIQLPAGFNTMPLEGKVDHGANGAPVVDCVVMFLDSFNFARLPIDPRYICMYTPHHERISKAALKAAKNKQNLRKAMQRAAELLHAEDRQVVIEKTPEKPKPVRYVASVEEEPEHEVMAAEVRPKKKPRRRLEMTNKKQQVPVQRGKRRPSRSPSWSEEEGYEDPDDVYDDDFEPTPVRVQKQTRPQKSTKTVARRVPIKKAARKQATANVVSLEIDDEDDMGAIMKLTTISKHFQHEAIDLTDDHDMEIPRKGRDVVKGKKPPKTHIMNRERSQSTKKSTTKQKQPPQLPVEEVAVVKKPMGRSRKKVKTESSEPVAVIEQDTKVVQSDKEPEQEPVLPSPLSSIWLTKKEKVDASVPPVKHDLVWNEAIFIDNADPRAAQSEDALVLFDDSGRSAKRQSRSVQQSHIRQNLLMGNLDPHTMVQCESYRTKTELVTALGRTSRGAATLDAPFDVQVHPDAVFVCDLHAHLATCEIIGFLGGRWDEEKRVLYIQAAFPCRSLVIDGDDGSTDVEMDPGSEIELREIIENAQLEVVGWYHSHPAFAPDPSIRDIENQASYQQLFQRRKPTLLQQDQKQQADEVSEPFVGLIVGTYDTRRDTPVSLFRYFHVRSERVTGREIFMPFELVPTTRLYRQVCAEEKRERLKQFPMYPSVYAKTINSSKQEEMVVVKPVQWPTDESASVDSMALVVATPVTNPTPKKSPKSANKKRKPSVDLVKTTDLSPAERGVVKRTRVGRGTGRGRGRGRGRGGHGTRGRVGRGRGESVEELPVAEEIINVDAGGDDVVMEDEADEAEEAADQGEADGVISTVKIEDMEAEPVDEVATVSIKEDLAHDAVDADAKEEPNDVEQSTDPVVKEREESVEAQLDEGPVIEPHQEENESKSEEAAKSKSIEANVDSVVAEEPESMNEMVVGEQADSEKSELKKEEEKDKRTIEECKQVLHDLVEHVDEQSTAPTVATASEDQSKEQNGAAENKSNEPDLSREPNQVGTDVQPEVLVDLDVHGVSSGDDGLEEMEALEPIGTDTEATATSSSKASTETVDDEMVDLIPLEVTDARRSQREAMARQLNDKKQQQSFDTSTRRRTRRSSMGVDIPDLEPTSNGTNNTDVILPASMSTTSSTASSPSSVLSQSNHHYGNSSGGRRRNRKPSLTTKKITKFNQPRDSELRLSDVDRAFQLNGPLEVRETNGSRETATDEVLTEKPHDESMETFVEYNEQALRSEIKVEDSDDDDFGPLIPLPVPMPLPTGAEANDVKEFVSTPVGESKTQEVVVTAPAEENEGSRKQEEDVAIKEPVSVEDEEVKKKVVDPEVNHSKPVVTTPTEENEVATKEPVAVDGVKVEDDKESVLVMEVEANDLTPVPLEPVVLPVANEVTKAAEDTSSSVQPPSMDQAAEPIDLKPIDLKSMEAVKNGVVKTGEEIYSSTSQDDESSDQVMQTTDGPILKSETSASIDAPPLPPQANCSQPAEETKPVSEKKEISTSATTASIAFATSCYRTTLDLIAPIVEKMKEEQMAARPVKEVVTPARRRGRPQSIKKVTPIKAESKNGATAPMQPAPECLLARRKHHLDALREQYGPDMTSCIEQLIALVDYYCVFERRTDLNDVWKAKIKKSDKIEASLRGNLMRLKLPIAQRESFLSDLMSYLKVSWELHS